MLKKRAFNKLYFAQFKIIIVSEQIAKEEGINSIIILSMSSLSKNSFPNKLSRITVFTLFTAFKTPLPK